jgi:signal transduction histidine kinase
MNFYTYKKRWKVLLFLAAASIGLLSLYYTNILVKKMSNEERKRMMIWAEATRQISISELDQEINFYLNVIQNNTTIPVILTNIRDSITSSSNSINLPPKREHDNLYLQKRLMEMKEAHEPIIIQLNDNDRNYIYYDDSTILKQLSYYPFVQLSVIALFIAVAYLAFSSSRKAEQNQVWVGMSKETAHQLGTPISSLMAWIEILHQNDQDETYIAEMQKDIDRLMMITDRFSKIGSLPDLPLNDLGKTIENAVNYMRTRTSANVAINIKNLAGAPIILPLNTSLFNWVIENLIKNAVDAMDGKGAITITIEEQNKHAVILVSDTGKGLPKNKFKTIFNPGYTSKDRGWGLGLSLAKRIIENYHRGKIMVHSSEINIGTTFKIILPK